MGRTVLFRIAQAFFCVIVLHSKRQLGSAHMKTGQSFNNSSHFTRHVQLFGDRQSIPKIKAPVSLTIGLDSQFVQS
jgi:hypothetical protein